MPRRLVGLTALAQGALVAGLGACLAIDPHAVSGASEGGVSNYGVHAATAAWYTAAFALDALGLALVARASRGSVRAALRVEAVLLVATLASTYPYQHGEPWHGLHVVVGSALVLYQLALSLTVARGPSLLVALALEVVGVTIAALAILGAGHQLFVGQALSTLGFAPILVGAVARRTG